MAPVALVALPHCLGLPYWHYQLVLSLYLHQLESHQLSLHKWLTQFVSERQANPYIGPGTPGSDKNKSLWKSTASKNLAGDKSPIFQECDQMFVKPGCGGGSGDDSTKVSDRRERARDTGVRYNFQPPIVLCRLGLKSGFAAIQQGAAIIWDFQAGMIRFSNLLFSSRETWLGGNPVLMGRGQIWMALKKLFWHQCHMYVCHISPTSRTLRPDLTLETRLLSECGEREGRNKDTNTDPTPITCPPTPSQLGNLTSLHLVPTRCNLSEPANLKCDQVVKRHNVLRNVECFLKFTWNLGKSCIAYYQYLDVFLIGQLLRFCLTICADVFFSSLWIVFRDVAIKSAAHQEKPLITLFENQVSLHLN